MPDLIIARPTPLRMIGRGGAGRCPACGGGQLFSSWLKVAPACSECEAAIGVCRADDAPPYFVLLITGHILVPVLVWVEETTTLSSLAVSSIFLPLTVFMVLGLLQPVKGAIIGWMMHLGMHLQSGFPIAAPNSPSVECLPQDYVLRD